MKIEKESTKIHYGCMVDNETMIPRDATMKTTMRFRVGDRIEWNDNDNGNVMTGKITIRWKFQVLGTTLYTVDGDDKKSYQVLRTTITRKVQP
jgi:hypothetical protein